MSAGAQPGPRAAAMPGAAASPAAPGAAASRAAASGAPAASPAASPAGADLPLAPAGPDAARGILKIAILAVGGQGGGVLTSWITELARRGGYRAQATSVAGVAQRTGSTIYYVEMAPDTGRLPVFALAPAPGDVDVLVAAELMEAGRAVLRGFVTPDRTTVVASSHRVLATVEKVVPGDGRVDAAPVMAELRKAAHRVVCLDLEAAAEAAGSVISASLFGALAGSGALPFERRLYEETIRASGRGIEPSLAAFAAGCDAAAGAEAPQDGQSAIASRPAGVAWAGAGTAGARDGAAPEAPASSLRPSGPARLRAAWDGLAARVEAMPPPVRDMARRGLAKVVDYQDPAYGAQYLDRLDRALAAEDAARGWALSVEAARHLANAMCYDDLIRVADLKTRSARGVRLRREQGVPEAAVLQVTEYFHPRGPEVSGTLPAALGRWIEARPRLLARLDRAVNRGRRLRTDSLRGYVALWLIAALRPVRRRLWRHAVEEAHLEAWYALALREAARDYPLGTEILRCRRLIKGYSDTHARGRSKFDRVLGALEMLRGRADAAEWIARLRQAALRDAEGRDLDGALRTVASFGAPAQRG